MNPSEKIYSSHLEQLAQAIGELQAILGIQHDYFHTHKYICTHDHPLNRVQKTALEMVICRAIERFEYYTLRMARTILDSHLEIALSKTTKKIEMQKLVPVLNDPDKMRELLRDQATENLSLAGLHQIKTFFKETLGIPIISDNSTWWLGLLTANRNAVVHGDGNFDAKADLTLRAFGWKEEHIVFLRQTDFSPHPSPTAPSDYSFGSGIVFMAVCASIMENTRVADERLCVKYKIPQTFSQEDYDTVFAQFGFHDVDPPKNDTVIDEDAIDSEWVE
jgi:hypothetical protein